MRAAQLSRCAALLLLLGAALATVPGRPTVMEVRNGWDARSGVSVASASQAGAQDSYDYTEEKEVCLQEVNRKECQTQRVERCNEPGGTCTSLSTAGGGAVCTSDIDIACSAVTSFYTSELACCHDKHDYNYGHGTATVGDHLWGGSHGTIGTCDWTIHHVETAIIVSANIEKLGAASAICYFGVDSQECGGPFCERMVMSLEGYVYGVNAVYSYWGNTDTGVCDIDGNARLAAPRKVRNAPQSNNKKATDNTRAAPVKPASSDASAQYYDGGHYEDRKVFEGTAIVINGVVITMAGPRKDKWDSGVFEYVLRANIDTDAADAVTALDPNVPWVRDKSYKFTFYKSAHGY